ncbi:hypothetical protein QBC39DRAFT_386816 [Podospora conica]|nr:hypothetical protein QBC39DRAFT_386816 [Schizothecium conicum]
MTKPTPLFSLLAFIALPALCLAQGSSTSLYVPMTWHFRGFADDNCQEELINETGEDPVYCNNTTLPLRSYRFSATPEPTEGETFGLRLYVEQECNIPAIIYDGWNDGTGDCRTTVPYNSWNVFPW